MFNQTVYFPRWYSNSVRYASSSVSSSPFCFFSPPKQLHPLPDAFRAAFRSSLVVCVPRIFFLNRGGNVILSHDVCSGICNALRRRIAWSLACFKCSTQLCGVGCLHIGSGFFTQHGQQHARNLRLALRRLIRASRAFCCCILCFSSCMMRFSRCLIIFSRCFLYCSSRVGFFPQHVVSCLLFSFRSFFAFACSIASISRFLMRTIGTSRFSSFLPQQLHKPLLFLFRLGRRIGRTGMGTHSPCGSLLLQAHVSCFPRGPFTPKSLQRVSTATWRHPGQKRTSLASLGACALQP